nr:HWE histidine kinase domain-containing protein [Methylopila capsulata]
MRRQGVVEDTHWNYSFTPILGDDGRVSGVFNQGHETTDRVLHVRSQDFLIQIGDLLRAATERGRPPTEVLETTVAALGGYFGASRCGYCEIEDGRICLVHAEWRRDDGVVSVRPGRHDLTDYGGAMAMATAAGEVIVRNDLDADPDLSAEERARFSDIGVAANLVVPIAREGRAFALVFVHADRPRRWRSREIATFRDAVDRMSLAYERALATHRMEQSERRFAALFSQTAVGFAEIDLDGRVLRVNDSMRRLLGRGDDVQGVPMEQLLHPVDREKWRRLLAQNGRDGESFGIEKRYLRPDGSEVWAVSTVTRLMGEGGSPGEFFVVAIDVSERREAERLRGLLVAELNHRVRNNIVTVQSLVRHSRMNAVTPQEFETALDARLVALARAHDLLMRETWTAASLGELVVDTLAPYAAGSVGRVGSQGPTILLAPTAAVTLNMALHELATNAAKFGALSNEEGRVVVSWSVKQSAIDLVWRESGGPIVAPPQRRGFGRRLIERGATQELGGSVTLSFAPSGVTCAFRIPLSHKVMAP